MAKPFVHIKLQTQDVEKSKKVKKIDVKALKEAYKQEPLGKTKS